MSELDTFFNEVKTNKDSYNGSYYSSLIYICAEEFGWTQQQFDEIEIPYLLDLLKARMDAFKEREKQAKKKR